MMWIDIGIIFFTLRTALLKPGLRRLVEHGHEAFPPVRGNEEYLLRQREADGCSLFAEASRSTAKMAAITYLCNAGLKDRADFVIPRQYNLS